MVRFLSALDNNLAKHVNDKKDIYHVDMGDGMPWEVGVCWPAQDTIAEEINCPSRTVRYALARLEKDAWVAIISRQKKTGHKIKEYNSQGSPNSYSFELNNVVKALREQFEEILPTDKYCWYVLSLYRKHEPKKRKSVVTLSTHRIEESDCTDLKLGHEEPVEVYGDVPIKKLPGHATFDGERLSYRD